MSYKTLKLMLPLLLASCFLPAQPASAYLLDKTNHVVTISPGTDNATTTADIRNALTYLAGRSDKSTRWTAKFKPGKYYLTVQLVTSNLENVDFVSDPANPAMIIKAPTWSSSNGEFMLFNRFSKNVSMKGFSFYGKTDYATSKDPVWPDQGIYFGSSNGVTIDNNKFNNFGNAALRVATYEKDPVAGVNSFNTKVINNTFNNIFQISTTSNDMIHGATANYVLENNKFYNLRGSVKFASRTAGAKNVKLVGNTINGGDHYGFEIDNYDDFEISGNTIQNVKEVAINIYTNARAPKGFPWGDNFTIARNVIETCGRGIRFSPDPYSDGYKPLPHNLVIDANTLTNITNPTTSLPAISITNGIVDGIKILNNKMNKIASKNYIGISSGSTNITKLGNYVDGVAYGPQPTGPVVTDPAPAPAPAPSDTTKPTAPSNLAGQYNGSTAVKLNFTDNATNETRHEVWFGTNGSQYSLLAKLDPNVASHSHAVQASSTPKTYYYTVRAVNANGVSGFCKSYKVDIPAQTASQPAPAPAPTTGTQLVAPSNLSASLSGSTASVRWTDNATNEDRLEIWVSNDGSKYSLLQKLGANTTSYSFSPTFSSGGKLYLTVRAVAGTQASTFAKAATLTRT